MKRNRPVYLAAMAAVMALGLLSRRNPEVLPWFIAQYAGDTLWAVAAFLGIGILLPRASTPVVAALALAVSYAVELSQLYQAPWINSIRHTLIGGLILGYGFYGVISSATPWEWHAVRPSNGCVPVR